VSRIAWDSPGMEQNILRPGKVHSGTMKRPGMNFSRAKFADFALVFFKNQKVKIYLQHNQIWLCSKLSSSTELI